MAKGKTIPKKGATKKTPVKKTPANPVGRPKAIKTPEDMRKYFEQYAEETKANPIKVQDYVGKDGDEVYRKKERPLTMEGFENWLFKNEIINDLGDYFSNKDGRYSDFATICRAIKQMIRQDQLEGGLAGIYNPSITQRICGLTEKQETAISNPDGTPIRITLKL